MWSAGITRCDNVWLVLYARRFLSPNLCSCMKLVCAPFSIATTVNGPAFSCEPLPAIGLACEKSDRKAVPKRTAQPSFFVTAKCDGHHDNVSIHRKKEKEHMAKTYQVPMFVHVGNILTLTLLRAGFKLVGPFIFFGNYPMYLLTVRGRKSGQPRTVALVIIERNGKRYVGSPYGIVDWVRNLRVAGEAVLTRGRRAERVTARELPLGASALRETLPSIEARAGQIVVTGGGATGIETAAEVASAYPHIKVRLVTREPLALFLGKGVASSIRRRLVRLGVEILDQTTVAAVRAHSVIIDQGSELACDLCIWTGGFVAPPLAREAGLAVNERNQIVVDPFLRSISHPEIYAIGDAAHPREDPGAPVRMSAVTATIMGAHGADCLSAVLRGKAPRPLSFAYLGQGIALGRHNAIGFNNYPDDKPIPPYFTGWLGYLIREGFVRYLAAATQRPGIFVWVGKRRYERAQRRQQAREQKKQMQPRRA